MILEMRLIWDCELEVMGSDLRADIVRVIVEKIADMSIRVFGISTLPKVYCIRQSCFMYPLSD